ncbi:MAG: C39 family peptidase [Chloroflexi bacterium]|nr:C39 family peptidase [Chloroflexota bacterium]
MNVVRQVYQHPEFCGPTTLEMMFSAYGVLLSQDTIAEEIGVPEIMRYRGTALYQLYQAAQRLRPDFVLMAKYGATVSDLDFLTGQLDLPVAVEWQGVFLAPDGKRFEEGHYSVVVGLDRQAGDLLMLDPDLRAAFGDGRVSVAEFEARWWDWNTVLPDGNLTQPEIIWNDRLAFVLASPDQLAQVQSCGLQPGTLSLMLAHSWRRQPLEMAANSLQLDPGLLASQARVLEPRSALWQNRP